MVVEYLLKLLLAVGSIPFSDKTFAIDVSHYNSVQNWQTALNYEFEGRKLTGVFMKATEGTGYTDPEFNNWMTRVSSAPQIKFRCAYHFHRVESTGAAQANHLISVLKANPHFNKATDYFAIDVENYSGRTKVTPQAYASNLNEFISTMKANGYNNAIVYTAYYYWTDNIGTAGKDIWSKAKLWLASYGADDGHIPAGDKWYTLLPAGASRASFWQFTSKGKVSGLSSNTDLDLIGTDIGL